MRFKKNKTMKNISIISMNHICTVQMLKQKIYPDYDSAEDFKILSKLDEESLFELINNLISKYNETLK
jgi:hypothetical protein